MLRSRGQLLLDLSAAPKAHTFTEDFSGPLDPAKWNVIGTAPIVEGGNLRVLADPTFASELSTAGRGWLDLSESHVLVPFIRPAADGTDSFFDVRSNGGGLFRWIVLGNGGMYARHVSPGNVVTDAFVTRDPVAHYHLRIRASNTTVYWETSPDGTTWTQHHSVVTTNNLTETSIHFLSGGSGGGSMLLGSVGIADPMPVTTPAQRRDRTGVAVPAWQLLANGGATRDEWLDDMVEMGGRWLRTDLSWLLVEGTQGVYEWAQYDALVAAANARGIKIAFILDETPAWARPASTTQWYAPDTAARRDAYAAFCAAAVNRYKASVQHWEVWNEPNHPPFWTQGPNVASYAALLAAAYPAIKGADPTATVITGGTAGTQTASGGILTATWYTQLYATAGFKASCDAITVHTYQNVDVAPSGVYFTGELSVSEAVRRIMDDNGDRTKPMWDTEHGAPSEGDASVSTTIQRDMLVANRDIWWRREWPVGGVKFLYTLRDIAAPGTGNRENYFGITTLAGAPKPIYTVTRDWISGSTAAISARSPADAAAAADSAAAAVTRPLAAGDAAGAMDAATVQVGHARTGGDAAAATDAATYALTAGTPPAEVLNIGTGAGRNYFELQMARSGDATFTTQSLATLAAGYAEDPHFVTVAGPRVQLQVAGDAPLVGTSTGPRAELREVLADGSNAAWDANVGVREMRGRTRIMTGSPDVVIAQLHNGAADRIAIRTQLVSGTLRLRIRVNGSSVTTSNGTLDLANPYVLGTEVHWKIRLDGGAIAVYVGDMVTPVYTAPAGTLAPTAGVTTWYWKAGAYAQAAGTATDLTRVELSDLAVTHQTAQALDRSAADLAGAADAAASATDRTRAAADVAAAADATTSVVDVQRAGADLAPTADNVTAEMARAATAADGAGAVDAATAVQQQARTASDAAGGTDAATWTMGATSAVASVAAATDAAATSLAATRQAADAAGAGSAATWSADAARGAADTAQAADAADSTASRPREATDAAGTADAAAATLEASRAPDSQAAATDAVAWLATAGRTPTSAAAATDAATWTMGAAGVYTDPAAATDAATWSATRARAAADAAAVTDAAAWTLGAAAAAADEAAATDAVSYAVGRGAAATDAAGATDAASYTLARVLAVEVSSTAGADDEATPARAVVRQAASAAGTDDEASPGRALTAGASSAAGATDGVVAYLAVGLGRLLVRWGRPRAARTGGTVRGGTVTGAVRYPHTTGTTED